MGLDAVVYCDCLEKNALKAAPKSTWHVYVGEDGQRTADIGDLPEQLQFDQWNSVEACSHEFGALCHSRIGNIGEVALLRGELSKYPTRFPIILTKIIYNGIHSGDQLDTDQFPVLRTELNSLADLHSSDSIAEHHLRRFENDLNALLDAATTVNKPIVF